MNVTARRAAKRLSELSESYGFSVKDGGDPASLFATELIHLIEVAYMANDRSAKGQKAYERAVSLLRELGKVKS